ncbi:MAG TPA: hypothetical protein VFP65_29325, partial [Anaeromyxobacteraceae bacterium]|nr:hypothetical protein [Anaeromyxobacteraceae bacterium]
DPSRVASAARGWAGGEGLVAAASARRASTAKKKAPARAPAAAPGPSATATELAFLKDKRISIEDKLFLFMALMEKKGNQELQQALTDYAQRREQAQAAERAKATASASGGGGFLGGLVDAVQGVVKQVGGPLLASAATAVGAPYLAPAALSFGGSLGADLVGTVADLAGIDHGKKASAPRASGSSASSTASAASPADEFDEKLEFAKIQRLYEKQQTMFTCLSNLMKAMHDTQMATVNNLR